MRKKYIVMIAVLAIVVLGGLIGGWAITQAGSQQAQDTPEPTESPDTAPTAAYSFPVPTPIPSFAVGTSSDSSGEATVTQDEDGNLVITPDWEAKSANATGTEPAANMGGSGGGSMDLQDGVYLGDHPEETPAATVTPAETSTPAPESTSDGPPSQDGSYNGEISPDGKYMWGIGFGWIERGDGSYGIPGQGTHTEDGGETVGEM